MKKYGLVVLGLGLYLLMMTKLEILSILSSILHIVFGIDLIINFRYSSALDIILTIISMLCILLGSSMMRNEDK